jgi:hypothetical protein
MAFEYKGWYLGFTLTHPNKKGQHWCQLSKQDVDVIWETATGKDWNTTSEFIVQLKGVQFADAQQILSKLIEIRDNHLRGKGII